MNGNIVGNLVRYREALESRNLSRIREARAWLLRLIKLRGINENTSAGFIKRQEELLNALLNYQKDFPEGELRAEDAEFLVNEIERLKAILYPTTIKQKEN